MYNFHYVYDNPQKNIHSDETIPVYTVEENWKVPTTDNKTKVVGRKRNAKRETHWNRPMAFDIETTAFNYTDEMGNEQEGRAMFVWQFAVDTNFCIMGRTWEEFSNLLKKLNEDDRHYHIFVHNLSYEAYFMLQTLSLLLGELEVKLLKSLRVWEVTWGNIHFHDSAVISMMSLESTCLDYNKRFFKMKGDFDYDKRFTILTPLTETEIGYCLADVLGLSEYIDNLMIMYPTYTLFELPKTQTGFVRKEVLKLSREDRKYRDRFLKMALDKDMYIACQKAFDGGYTAGSIAHYGQYFINEDIRCRDITSSYPFQLVSNEYPINKFVKYEWEDINDWDKYFDLINRKCVIASYTFTGVELMCQEPRFSISRLDELGEYEAWNGKLIRADHFTRTMNEVTFLSFIKYYHFEQITVSNIYVADKGKLPKFMIDGNLKFFNDKSTLKGVDGKEVEYMKSKQMLNGIYGMSATAIVRDEWGINIDTMECSKTTPDMTEALDKYYGSENSFMCYQWACYVTSYARRQVFDMMDICQNYGTQIEGGNWLYTDTDSVYYISNPEIEEAFEQYNQSLCRDYTAITSKGKVTTMGEVTPDGDYCEFVQYGAKKYCKREAHGDRNLVITVAGVPKKAGAKVLKNDIYNFHPNLVFEGKVTGKLRPSYVFRNVDRVNVNGVPTLTASYQNLLPCDYKLSGIDEDPVEVIDNIINHFDQIFVKEN